MSEDVNDVKSVFSMKLCDTDLLKFADNANKYNLGVGITLLCKGIVLSGITISGKEYYESVANSYGSAKDDTYSFANYFLNAAKERYNFEDEQDIPISFIHLRNVSMHSGNGVFKPLNGAYLRLKIEEIDGYIFGQSSND